MDFDAFTEGVLPGGLRNRSEIGVLVCYMLDSAGQPIPKDNLIELICENGFARRVPSVLGEQVPGIIYHQCLRRGRESAAEHKNGQNNVTEVHREIFL